MLYFNRIKYNLLQILFKVYAIKHFIFDFFYRYNFKQSNLSIIFGSGYEPVRYSTLCYCFYLISKFNLKFECFIDLGAGTGKSCLFFSRTLKNIDVIGVELSRELYEISLSNSSLFNIAFINSDVRNYIIPQKSCLLFMFNPFDDLVLNVFIKKNKKLLELNDILIIYVNDVYCDFLLNNGFKLIFRDVKKKISILKYY